MNIGQKGSDMKAKILALLAVGLLAGPMTANAIFIPTTTTVVSSLNPSFLGEAVTFTSLTTAQGSPVDTGGTTVNWYEGAVFLASVLIGPTGSTDFTTSVLSLGPHIIGAYYGGTFEFLPSSGAVNQSVLERPVPEPGTLALLGLGLAGLGLSRRRKAH